MVHAALSGTARLVAVFALAFASSLITLGASARLLRQTNMASCPINLATFCSTLPQKLFTNPCDPTCNSYINCKVPAGGAGSEQYCPAATPAFNQAQQYCDYAAKVVCNSTSASPPIPAAAAPPPKALSSPSPSKITPSPPPPPPPPRPSPNPPKSTASPPPTPSIRASPLPPPPKPSPPVPTPSSSPPPAASKPQPPSPAPRPIGGEWYTCHGSARWSDFQ